MKPIILKSKKRSIKGLMLGMVCAAICLFANAQDIVKHTIQFKGGSCVFDKMVEIPGGTVSKHVRVDFQYTLNEDATISTLMVLMSEGQFVAGKKKYKPNAIVTPMPKDNTQKIEETGIVSLTLQVPNATKVETLKFVFNKQEITLMSAQ